MITYDLQSHPAPQARLGYVFGPWPVLDCERPTTSIVGLSRGRVTEIKKKRAESRGNQGTPALLKTSIPNIEEIIGFHRCG